jgi:hypothetical protein
MYRFDQREKLDPDKTRDMAERFLSIQPEEEEVPAAPGR